MSESDAFIEQARGHGPLARGAFRVVVLESDARFSVRDFTSLEDARAYADDAASESADAWPIAKVFDERLVVVHQGSSFVRRG